MTRRFPTLAVAVGEKRKIKEGWRKDTDTWKKKKARVWKQILKPRLTLRLRNINIQTQYKAGLQAWFVFALCRAGRMTSSRLLPFHVCSFVLSADIKHTNTLGGRDKSTHAPWCPLSRIAHSEVTAWKLSDVFRLRRSSNAHAAHMRGRRRRRGGWSGGVVVLLCNYTALLGSISIQSAILMHVCTHKTYMHPRTCSKVWESADTQTPRSVEIYEHVRCLCHPVMSKPFRLDRIWVNIFTDWFFCWLSVILWNWSEMPLFSAWQKIP